MAGRTVDISTRVNALANEKLCDRLAEIVTAAGADWKATNCDGYDDWYTHAEFE